MIHSGPISFLAKTVTLAVLLALFMLTPTVALAQKNKRADAPPQFTRIISLKPNITQMLISLGVQNNIVGITKFCEPPNTTAQVIADYNSINIEAVLRLKPDLIIGSAENSQVKQYESLQQAKLNLKLFSFDSYAQMKNALVEIAALLSIPEKAQTLINGMDAKLAAVQTKLTTDTQIKKTFIAIVQQHPLMIASGNTYLSSLFEQAGLTNAFSANSIAYPVIDEEELVREIVDYTFDLSFNHGNADNTFLNKTTILLKIDNFLAAPQSVDHLVNLFMTDSNP